MDTDEWLGRLDSQIWKRIETTTVLGQNRTVHCTLEEEARRLTHEEWVKLVEIMNSGKFVVLMFNTRFGFNIGLALGRMSDPVYPGIPSEFEESLRFTAHHLPVPWPEAARDDRVSFNEAWAALSPFSHNPRNAELIQRAGLPPLGDKSYFDY